MNLQEVDTSRLKTIRRNLSFEERAYQKEEKENSNSSSFLSYNISVENCSYDEPDHIKNKVSLYLFSCINCIYYNEITKNNII